MPSNTVPLEEEDCSYLSPSMRDEYNFTFYKEKKENTVNPKNDIKTHKKAPSVDTAALFAVAVREE